MAHLGNKLLKTVYETIYVVDFTLLEDSPVLNEEIKSIGTWFQSEGKRWVCHTELSMEEFKATILKHVGSKDTENVSFYKDHLPFTGNHEVAF